MNGQQPAGSRCHDHLASLSVVAVAVYLAASITKLAIATTRTVGGHPSILGYIGLATIFVGYLIVVTRAPSSSRWIYFGVLTVGIVEAAFGPSQTKQYNPAYGVVVAAIIFLPLLYMRLWRPRVKMQRRPGSRRSLAGTIGIIPGRPPGKTTLIVVKFISLDLRVYFWFYGGETRNNYEYR
jgi:hypothetical protein